MPHYKGVSHKSDRKILTALLTNKSGLCFSELVSQTGLDKDTVSRRLKFLTKENRLIRIPLKGKRGHHVLYQIPWNKFEQTYFYVYKKPSEQFTNLQKDIETFVSEFGEIKEMSISQDMKVTIKLKNPEIKILISEEFHEFFDKYPWVGELPININMIEIYLNYIQGMLCPECFKNHLLNRIVLIEEYQYTCPVCGYVFYESESSENYPVTQDD